MKTTRKILTIGAAIAALIAVAGIVQAQAPPPPQVTSIGPSDLFQDVVNGYPTAQNQYAPASLLGNYAATLSGNNPENALIGGDATTNLWQRATTGSSVTTSFTYGGPDRWGYWSGTSTAMTVSRDSTAADLPGAQTYQYGFKMARTSGQTGIVQVCMLQALETVNSLQFSGQTAEIDFHATAGANFSGAGSAMTVYLVSGTGTDESAAKAAYTVNAGGGGTPGFTGGVATGVNVTISTTNQRYSVAIPVPAATTQVAVALCWTPVGTAGTNDYIALSGIQLTRNSALTALAGTAGVALNANDTRAKAFARRTQGLETLLQYRYYYQIAEGATLIPRFIGHATTAGAGDGAGRLAFPVVFPVTMRVAPTMAYTAGFAGFTTTAETTATVCSALAAATSITYVVSTQQAMALCSLTSSTIAVGLSMTIADDNGSGQITANAEL